ncbi:MAG: TIGR03663 family protein [Calditrichaeota bacterium]|nr:MAG: TIGR03663 family protein [Calditrichota bacterium]
MRRPVAAGLKVPLKSFLTSKAAFFILFAIILFLAFFFRIIGLEKRPLHTDEAVHGVKFGYLLENDDYRYDPHEYHGPTLIFSTLVPAWIKGSQNIKNVSVTMLRSVPVFYGMLLVIITLSLLPLTKRSVTLSAALLTAVSPAFVFFSRYYIMEIMLVLFTVALILSLHRYYLSLQMRWIILAGALAGLMHATKETCIITWIAVFSAGIMVLLTKKGELRKTWQRLPKAHLVTGLLSAIIVSSLLFTSFFRHPRGIIDSILTFQIYLNRGSGDLTAHIHPWFSYFQWLLWNKQTGTPLWTEFWILSLGMVGALRIFSSPPQKHRHFWQFLTIYTLLMTLIYAAIPYKTPWSMLSFYHGWLLLAAFAVAELAAQRASRIFIIVYIFLGCSHLSLQSWQLIHDHDTDESNPYIYAHTHRDIYKLVDGIHELCRASTQGQKECLEIICPGDDYWPLPWYLRDCANVGYYNHVDLQYPAARIIVSSPSMQEGLVAKLYELPPPGQRNLYIPFFKNGVLLRDGVELDLYVRKDLWDEWYQNSP